MGHPGTLNADTGAPSGAVALRVTEAQRKMLIESGPNPRDTGGYGVELRTGADYAVAKALTRRSLGHYEQGQWGLCGLYFNNADGIRLRADLLGIAAPDDPDEFAFDDEGDDAWDDCGLMPDGQCTKAGSEECDWICGRLR